MALLETDALQVTVGDVCVCRELALRVEPGQCWGVLGRNGVGKTTLLHTLAGLRAPGIGTVRLEGTPLTELARRKVAQRLGVLFQDVADPFPATVLETALIGRHPFLGVWQWEGNNELARAREALDAVGLANLAQRAVQTLSGGERRRLAVATLLTQAPKLYLLDEPTNHLDLHFQIAILGLLQRLAYDGDKGVLTILHDVNLAARFCDHLLLLLGDGQTRSGRTADVLDEAAIEALYGHPVVRVDAPGGSAWLPR